MRTRIILICVLVVAFAAALLVAGSAKEATEEARGVTAGRVAASFYPLAFVADAVSQPESNVANLTPPGSEPHDLEIDAGAIETLQEADVVLLMGRDFQPQLEEAAERASGEVLELLETPGLELLGNEDPHVWLDPARFGVVAERIAEQLGRPEAGVRLVARLEALDREFRRGLADCERREIVTSHEAFSYLADRYGLEEIPITGLSPEAEPSPADLSASIEEVRRSGATVVFSEDLVSSRLADTVARETGADTDELHTLEGIGAEEQARGQDYFTKMRDNLRLLREAMGCR